MTTYTKSTDFAAKDALLTGNPSKVVKGVEINTEFDNIAAADATSLKSGGSLGTPSAGVLTNATGLPISTGVTGLGTGVATSLAVNVGSAGAPVVNGGALGTPSSGTVTNLTGTASININGTVGATTPASGAFTSLSASSTVSGSGFDAYLASPPAIGGTVAAAGTFTNLTATGNAALGDAEATDTHAIKGATTVLANSADPAMKVTQTGAGNAFVVEDASSDTTPFVIDADGRVVVGYTAAQTSTLLGYAKQQTIGTDTQTAQNAVWNFSNDNGPSWLALYKSRGAVGVNAIVQNADAVGRLAFFAADGVNYLRCAQISVEVDGTPGVNSMPTRIELATTAPGAGNPVTHLSIDSVGNVCVITATGGLGYGTGAGGTVTQATSKSTAVTLNKPTGQIVMNNAALADATNVTFGFNNSIIAATDTVVFTCAGGFGANYLVWGVNPSAGAITVAVRNISGISQSQALVINFTVIKGSTS